MSANPGVLMNLPQADKPLRQRIFGWPSTRPGWWSVGLAVVFVLAMILNGAVFMQVPERVAWQRTILIFYGFAMLACGLASLIVALVAMIRQRERSWLVWLPLLTGLFVTFLLLGEFLVPH